MINIDHIVTLVIRPTLIELNMHNEAAENLMIGTALVESHLTHLRQTGGGPALGLWQMEPATHDDMWATYLNRKPDLAQRVRGLASHRYAATLVDAADMIGNLYYACAMARLKYWRVPQALPAANNIEALGYYWKQHYNTAGGKGRVGKFVKVTEGVLL